MRVGRVGKHSCPLDLQFSCLWVEIILLYSSILSLPLALPSTATVVHLHAEGEGRDHLRLLRKKTMGRTLGIFATNSERRPVPFSSYRSKDPKRSHFNIFNETIDNYDKL